MTIERAKELLPVITAYAEGKTVQRTPGFVNDWSDDCSPTWDSAYKYRIKPEPRLRPWRPEEVPVGSVVVLKAPTLTKRVIICSKTATVTLGGHGQPIGFDELLKDWTLADGSPCGVEEPS